MRNSEAQLRSDFVFQMVSSDGSPLTFLPTDAQAQVSPPPPYPSPQQLPQPLLQQPHAQEPPQQPQAAPSLPQPDFQLLTGQVSPGGSTGLGGRLIHPDFQLNTPPYSLKGSSLTSFFQDVSFDQQSMRPGPAFTQQVSDRPGACLFSEQELLSVRDPHRGLGTLRL